MVNPWADLSGSEFDVEHLFDFMSMPGVDRKDGGSSGSELRGEDHGIIGQDSYTYQELIKHQHHEVNNVQEPLDSKAARNPSEFDDLDQFIGCQDHEFYFLH